MDWRHRALCRDEDPELFFPIGTTGPAAQQVDEAKAVCRRCSVTAECLAWALETGQDAGVWGGLSDREPPRPDPRGPERPHGSDHFHGVYGSGAGSSHHPRGVT